MCKRIYFENIYRNEICSGFLLEENVQYWSDEKMYPSQCWIKICNPLGVLFTNVNRAILATRLSNVRTQKLDFLLRRVKEKQLQEDIEQYKGRIKEERLRILSFKNKFK